MKEQSQDIHFERYMDKNKQMKNIIYYMLVEEVKTTMYSFTLIRMIRFKTLSTPNASEGHGAIGSPPFFFFVEG